MQHLPVEDALKFCSRHPAVLAMLSQDDAIPELFEWERPGEETIQKRKNHVNTF